MEIANPIFFFFHSFLLHYLCWATQLPRLLLPASFLLPESTPFVKLIEVVDELAQNVVALHSTHKDVDPTITSS